MKVFIELECGDIFTGETKEMKFKEEVGIFDIYMGHTGYECAITDEKYRDKLLVMNTPTIGTYGISLEATGHSEPVIKGLICRDLCNFPSNFSSEMTIEAYLNYYGIMGIQGVDTRSLIRTLREHGSQAGVISSVPLVPSRVKALLREGGVL